jgi:hypothetical protein
MPLCEAPSLPVILAVQRHVHEELVEGAVEERGVHRDDRVQPARGEPGGRGERVLLGDADVDAALGERLGEGHEPGGAEHRGGDRDDVRAAGAQPDHLLGEHVGPAGGGRAGRQAGLRVERLRAVHLLGLVVLRRRVAAPLLGDRVHHDGPAEVPGAAQRGLERRDVVPVDGAEVLESEVGEQLLRRQRVLQPGLDRVQARVQRAADDRCAGQRGLAGVEDALVARLQAQRGEPVGQPADRGRVGPAVVVDHDDDVAVLRGGDVVERLPGHAAGQRAVPDDRHDVALLPGERVRPGEAVGPGQRGRRVAGLDDVVRALGAARVAGQAAGLLEPVPAVLAPGQQLVDVGLVAGVPHEGVARGVEHPVQGDGELDDAEVGSEVAAGARHALHQEAADLLGELGQPVGPEGLEVGRAANGS